jgi:hypothetical protein
VVKLDNLLKSVKLDKLPKLSKRMLKLFLMDNKFLLFNNQSNMFNWSQFKFNKFNKSNKSNKFNHKLFKLQFKNKLLSKKKLFIKLHQNLNIELTN